MHLYFAGRDLPSAVPASIGFSTLRTGRAYRISHRDIFSATQIDGLFFLILYEHYAQISAAFRRAGTPIPLNDV